MIACYRCNGDYEEEKGDGFGGLCPKCADVTDNTLIYGAIWDVLEKRFGKGLLKVLGEEIYGEVDDLTWQFIDEITDLCERQIQETNDL